MRPWDGAKVGSRRPIPLRALLSPEHMAASLPFPRGAAARKVFRPPPVSQEDKPVAFLQNLMMSRAQKADRALRAR